MRFDDMLATVIAGSPASPALRRNRWRQIADIVAQKGAVIDRRIVARALAELAREKSVIPLADRIATAIAIARHADFPPIVVFFAHDAPDVARPLLARISLPETHWTTLIPALGPYGRSVLRGRRDLPGAAARALAALGPTDMRLGDARAATRKDGAGAEAVRSDDDNSGQIRELVRRIEAFRENRERAAVRKAEEPLGISSFHFATGVDGAIDWVESAPRGPLIGLDISQPAQHGLPGPDAAAAGAFRHRDEIRDARIVLPPLPGFAGSWRFSALPRFDRASGRFEGYRGTVRRAAVGEDPTPVPRGEDRGDAMRQLVHELRTPLNAISGFAQMIEAEMMGPAGDNYRGLAARIAADAGASLTMIDSLDLALVPRERDDEDGDSCDLAAVAADVARDLAPLLDDHGVTLTVADGQSDIIAGLPAALAERVLRRLLTVLIQAGRSGSRIDVAMAGGGTSGQAAIAIGLPEPLAGATPEDLRNPPATGEDGPQAARLALAFGLRLVDRTVDRVGGAMLLRQGKLILRLPGDMRVLRTG